LRELTDVHIADGEFPPTPYPIIPGHEFAGCVVAAGEGGPLAVLRPLPGLPRRPRQPLRQLEVWFELTQQVPLGAELRRHPGKWERQIGPADLENLETHLAALVGNRPLRFDTPGWMTRDLGEPA